MRVIKVLLVAFCILYAPITHASTQEEVRQQLIQTITQLISQLQERLKIALEVKNTPLIVTAVTEAKMNEVPLESLIWYHIEDGGISIYNSQLGDKDTVSYNGTDITYIVESLTGKHNLFWIPMPDTQIFDLKVERNNTYGKTVIYE